MPSKLKLLLEEQLKQDFAEVDNMLLIDYQRLDSEKMALFRDKLRAANLQMEVVKNTIFAKAVAELPANTLVQACEEGGKLSADRPLSGPVGIITGGESAIDQARFAVDWLKGNQDTISFKAALMGTEVFAASDITELSKLPSRKELLGMMANVVQSPIQKLAATVQAGYARILWGMNALAEKLEKAN